MRQNTTLKRLVLGLIGVLALAGCTSTEIVRTHPLLADATRSDHARVYVLRPNTERAMGFPDNPVTLELDERKLLTLGKGEYTLLRLKPRNTSLILRSLTAQGPFWTTTEISRKRTVNLEAGKTYYWAVKPVDGEFRGVYFIAEDIEAEEARQMTFRLHAVGAAKEAPL